MNRMTSINTPSWMVCVAGAWLCYWSGAREADAAPMIAYLDPGAGSLILQMIVGGTLGVIFLAKLFWQRILKFMTRLFKKDQDQPTDETDISPP